MAERSASRDMQLRCRGTMHGVLHDGCELEVRCKRRSCGAAPGVVVLHTFSLDDGTYTTRRFKDPVRSTDGFVR